MAEVKHKVSPPSLTIASLSALSAKTPPRSGSVSPVVHSTVAGLCCGNGFKQSNMPVFWWTIVHNMHNVSVLRRYVAAHGLKHREKTKSHSVCMETKELSVFCYDCDEFVINDTAEK